MGHFRRPNASLMPLTSGSSGPTTVKSGCRCSARVTSAATLPASIGTHSASAVIPPFPGAHQIFSTRRLCFNFQTRACSRPPPPTTKIFIHNAPLTTLLNDRGRPRACQPESHGRGQEKSDPRELGVRQPHSPATFLPNLYTACRWLVRNNTILTILAYGISCGGRISFANLAGV